jgi:hypothetical protein
MRKKTRWVAIVASLFFTCAVLQAATVTKKRTSRAHSTSTHASYHPVRYVQQTTSTHSKTVHKTAHRTTHHYRHYRHYRRRTYRHRVSLPRGPSPERITQIQTALSRGGYYKGDPSGKWDSDTVAALQKFQSAHNISASGKLDAPTLQKLGLGSDIAGVAAPRTVVPKGCCSAGPAVGKPAVPATIPANTTDSASAKGSQPANENSSKPTPGGSGASAAAAIAPTVNSSADGTSEGAAKSGDSPH